MLSNVISNLAKVQTVDGLVDFDRLFLDFKKIPTLQTSCHHYSVAMEVAMSTKYTLKLRSLLDIVYQWCFTLRPAFLQMHYNHGYGASNTKERDLGCEPLLLNPVILKLDDYSLVVISSQSENLKKLITQTLQVVLEMWSELIQHCIIKLECVVERLFSYSMVLQ